MSSSKTTTMNVLYPPTEFNMDYYMSSHMPMVLDKFKSYGMTGYTVTKLEHAVDGSPSEYGVLAVLEWTTGAEGIQKALGDHGEQVLGDIPNFTKDNPKIFVGTMTGRA